MTPTQRTLKWLRTQGKSCWIVEYWNPFAKLRQDVFGFGDILACLDKPTLIQTTSSTNHSARVRKIRDIPKIRAYALDWLRSGGQILVLSWEKGKRGEPRAEYVIIQEQP